MSLGIQFNPKQFSLVSKINKVKKNSAPNSHK